MSILANLLDPGTRDPAACLIEVGEGREGLGTLNAMVKSVEIITSRAEAAAATLVFEDRRIEDGSYLVSDSGLFERWQPIRLYADFAGDPVEILRGFIVALKPSFPASGGEVTVEISVLDESALLDRDHQRRTWGEDAPITDFGIVDALVSDTAVALDGDSAEGQTSDALQQDATALKFMRTRAEANGYELLFSPGKVYFGPYRLEGEIMPPLMVYAGRSTNCLSFAVDDDGLKPDAVTFETAPPQEGSTPEMETVTAQQPALGETVADAEGRGITQQFVQRLSREGDESPESARIRAQAVADAASFKLRATAEIDGALYGYVLRPGQMVSVDGSGTRYGGVYYTDKITHRFTEEGYRQTLELMRNATGEQTGFVPGSNGPLANIGSALSGLFGG